MLESYLCIRVAVAVDDNKPAVGRVVDVNLVKEDGKTVNTANYIVEFDGEVYFEGNRTDRVELNQEQVLYAMDFMKEIESFEDDVDEDGEDGACVPIKNDLTKMGRVFSEIRSKMGNGIGVDRISSEFFIPTYSCRPWVCMMRLGGLEWVISTCKRFNGNHPATVVNPGL
ncbi:unnamed protein product [Cylindrotheca closterium]|uniref:Uncharacterized protein n=1 Tax=Cylindrotheca closterium TaxID=2856 RepID=A0AAD2JP46_9STRA|nr:unnamed protein product [Cylindrotheca closterium]